MSSIRGTAGRGRARGRGPGQNAARGASSSRGRIFNAGAPRGASTPRVAFGQPSRGNATSAPRGIARTNGFAKQPSRGSALSTNQARGSWQERYDKLEKDRKRERAQAIAEGSIADPDRPRTLSEAITPVGRCMDMCAEYERVQRVVQKDIWPEETDPGRTFASATDREPDEARMVKKFRRAAAGIDEQLPSDLRPPHVLKQTCDFLFDEVIANAQDLGSVHHFVWDRTRAIRNDFTILQVSTPQDLAQAVECFERIVRFHILSLHQMAIEEKPYFAYDWQQDREQLDRTLLSLMQYYDDSRGKIALPNESEFRAYLVVFQLQDPIPDLEDRVQNWPIEVVKHPRVRKALTLYAAACNTLDMQGPLKPGAPHVVAQQDSQRFWNLVGSTRTSYLMACMAEIYFNLIRRTALQGLLRSTNQRSFGDSTMDDVCNMLSFDTEEQAETFCNRYKITFVDGADGQQVVDMSALKGRQVLPEPTPAHPKQTKSLLVEEKRFGRTFPAIINGLSVKEAQDAGMIDESAMFEDEAMAETPAGAQPNGFGEIEQAADDGQSLFLPDTNKSGTGQAEPLSTAQPSIFDLSKPAGSAFGQPSAQQQIKPSFSFGTASPMAFGAPSSGDGAPFVSTKADAAPEKQKFNFLSSAPSSQDSASKPSQSATQGTKGSLSFTDPPSPALSKSTTFGGFNFTANPSASDTSKSAPSPNPGGFNFTSLSAGGENAQNNTSSTMFGQPTKSTGSPFTFGAQSGAKKPPSSLGSSSAASTDKAPVSPKDNSASNSGFSFTSTTFGQPAKSTESAFSFQKPPSPLGLFSSTPSDKTSVSPKSDSAPKPNASISSRKDTGSSGNMFGSTQFGAPAAKPLPSPAPALQAKQGDSTSPHSSNFESLQPPPANAPPPKYPDAITSRKTSGSDQFNKPAKPSPLAQSFTFGSNPNEPEEKASAQPPPSTQQSLSAPDSVKSDKDEVHSTASHSPQQAPKELFPGRQSEPTQRKDAAHETKKVSPESDFSSIVTRIAEHITLDPWTGLLDQYLEFAVGKAITEVQDTIYYEKANAEADEFRMTVLSLRYGRLWRDICRHNRLARQGRERRKRNQRRLLENKSQVSETASLAGSESLFGGSILGSTRGSVADEEQRRQEMYGKKLQQSMGSGRWSRMANEGEARGGSKRPGSSLGPGSLAESRANGHKRFKSTSHVNENGRITKPFPTGTSGTANFARSSFLGSLSGEAPLRSTTKTNYFKLKAMGRPAISDSANARARKRHLSEMSASPAGSPASAAVLTPSSAAASPPAPNRSLQRRSSSAGNKVAKTKEDDDALFARLRAARENLKESTSFFQTEVNRTEDLRHSTSSYESPSLERARVEARWRASQSAAGNDATGPDVPAYRLRESKFVPRENYGKAIKRSRDFRASRSGNTSRPESRMDTHDLFDSPAAPNGQSSQAATPVAFPKPPPAPSFTSFAPTNAPVNGSPFSQTQTQWKVNDSTQASTLSTNGFGFGSFGQANQAPLDLQSGCAQPPPQPPTPFGSFLDKPKEVTEPEPSDHTIQPSQVDQSLESSFGQQTAANVHAGSSYQMQFAPIPDMQQNSYLSTRSELVTQEDSDDDIQITSVSMPHVNGDTARDTSVRSRSEDAVEEESEEDFSISHGHGNPYAALANESENEEEETQDETRWNDVPHAHGENAEIYDRYPPAPYEGKYEDDEDDGDIEDEDGEEFDDEEEEEEFGDTEEATEDDEDDERFGPALSQEQGQPRVSPSNNPALAGGQSEGDAIELSD